jgi:predicted signal transduction protein with EAL and GGDEF domain
VLARRSIYPLACCFKDVQRHPANAAGTRCCAGRPPAQSLPGAALARLAGSEFAACAPPRGGPRAGRGSRAAVHAALDRGFELEGLVAHARASIGIAVFPQHGTTRTELLHNADLAMYRAKEHGTGVVVYGPDGDDGQGRERLELLGDLRTALQTSEGLVLHYQPKADLDTAVVDGVEALVRWQHPVRGLILPDHFVPLAEHHGLMRAFTARVLRLALAQQRAWVEEGIELRVAVNLSAANLLDPGFPAAVQALLEEYGTPPGALQLELTENTIMLDPDGSLDVLTRLSELGIALSLDDFGTGYSSLAHLRRLPVSELKIDKSFVMDMLADRDDAIIVRSTIDLARNLRLHVVAEGVETAQHWAQLAAFGCHTAQGYHLARPLPAADVAPWLRNWEIERRPAAVRPGGDAEVRASALGALVDAAAAVGAASSRAERLDCFADHLGGFLGDNDLTVYEIDAAASLLRPVMSRGRDVEETMADAFGVGEGITGSAIRERRTRYVPRTDLDPTGGVIVGTELEPEALVSVPLLTDDRPVGALNVYRFGDDPAFSPLEVETIERFAALAAVALQPDPRRSTPAG